MSLRDAIRTPPPSVGLTIIKGIPTDPSESRTDFFPMDFVAPQFSTWFSHVDFGENTIHLFVQLFPYMDNYAHQNELLCNVCSYFKVREAVLYYPHVSLSGLSAKFIIWDDVLK